MEQNVQQRLLEELMKLAFSDASDAAGAPIKSSSKLKALELLGKAVGLFEGGEEEGGGNDLLEAILAATDGQLTVDN